MNKAVDYLFPQLCLRKEILTGLGVTEKWLINTIKIRNPKYFGHTKRHNSLKEWSTKEKKGERGRDLTTGHHKKKLYLSGFVYM